MAVFDSIDSVQVSESGVTIQYALENPSVAGTPGAYADMGCWSGDVNLNDQATMNQQQFSNWCIEQAATAAINQDQPGERTITLSGTIEMITGSTAFTDLETLNKSKDYFFVKMVATDQNATPNTYTLDYKVKLTGRNINFRQTGTSQIPLSIKIYTEKPTSGWGA